jgi:hypothetical protein
MIRPGGTINPDARSDEDSGVLRFSVGPAF